MMKKILRWTLSGFAYVSLMAAPTKALWAQPAAAGGGAGAGAGDSAAGSDALYEMGFHIGNLLPNQIDGATEIMGLGGIRGGFRFAPLTYAEAGFITGNGEGVEWKNLHVDLRMDIPVENLVALAYVGGDVIYYNGNGTGTRMVFGGHAGGGVHAHLSGIAWVRADMKFGFSPGTSMYFGIGLEFRI